MRDIDCFLIVAIVILLLCKYSRKDDMCPYPPSNRFENCCGKKDNFDCLPQDSSVCSPPANALYIGPSTYWIDYSRMIGNNKAYAIRDSNDWPITYDQAVATIQIGSTLCWNGQNMAKIIGIARHENMPYTAFIILDRTFDINLQGQNVIIKAPEQSTAPVVTVTAEEPKKEVGLADKFISYFKM